MADHDEEWHREIAKQQFNRCWDLIELAERSPDDEVDMLLAAMTSRWHWGQVGGAEQIATCLLYTSPSPRDKRQSRMPSSA